MEDRKANETKIGVVEARLNNLEAEMNTIAFTVLIIKTQMDQVQKKIEVEIAKTAARVADIDKMWVSKKPKDEANTSGTKFGDFPADCWTNHSGPLEKRQ